MHLQAFLWTLVLQLALNSAFCQKSQWSTEKDACWHNRCPPNHICWLQKAERPGRPSFYPSFLYRAVCRPDKSAMATCEVNDCAAGTLCASTYKVCGLPSMAKSFPGICQHAYVCMTEQEYYDGAKPVV